MQYNPGAKENHTKVIAKHHRVDANKAGVFLK
jgi:hypothetical protein